MGFEVFEEERLVEEVLPMIEPAFFLRDSVGLGL